MHICSWIRVSLIKIMTANISFGWVWCLETQLSADVYSHCLFTYSSSLQPLGCRSVLLLGLVEVADLHFFFPLITFVTGLSIGTCRSYWWQQWLQSLLTPRPKQGSYFKMEDWLNAHLRMMNCLFVKVWRCKSEFPFCANIFVDVSKDAGLSKGQGKHSTLHHSSVEGANLFFSSTECNATDQRINKNQYHIIHHQSKCQLNSFFVCASLFVCSHFIKFFSLFVFSVLFEPNW